MFEKDLIKHREYLSTADYDHARQLYETGMTYSQALHYLRGWAHDYAYEVRCDTAAAYLFNEMAYGND